MLSNFAQTLKKTLKRRGWIVKRYRPYQDKFKLLVRLCSDHGCGILIDAGANEGQFALELLEAGYRGKIFSIEPQLGPHEKLERRTSSTPEWHAAPRMCVGDRNGTTVLNIAANSVSSSILGVLEASKAADRGTHYVSSEEVPIRRLDDWAAEEGIADSAPLALKLDVQGYEHQVLAGARNLLPKVRVLILELSLAPLYEDAQSFSQLFRGLEDLGYVPSGIFPGFSDANTLRMLQVDAVFERPAAAQ